MDFSLVGKKINQYTFSERVGSSMNVYVGKDEENKKNVIIKVTLSKDDLQKKANDAGIKIGIELSQKCLFLVRYEEVVMKAGQFFTIMEYCGMGDLAKIIADHIQSNIPFTDEEIFRFLFHVGTAVQALHEEDIIHRDLKPDNIFLTTDNIFKVGDFGISRSISSSRNKTTLVMASIGYACPELLDGEEKLTKEMDIYSLGCILLEMLDLCHPFANERGIIQQSRILGGKANAAKRPLSPSAKEVRDFALLMVSTDPNKRPPVLALLRLQSVHAFLSVQYIRSLQAHSQPGEKEDAVEKRNVADKAPSSAVASVSTTAAKPPSSSSSTATRSLLKSAESSEDVAVSFRPHPTGGCSLTRTLAGEQCTCTRDCDTTMFLDHQITQGVFRWTVRGKLCGIYNSGIGVASPSELTRYENCFLGSKGSCCFKWDYRAPLILRGTVDHYFQVTGTIIPDESLVAVEVDTATRRLYFFLGEKKIPHAISEIPVPLYFGVSVYRRASFTSISFRRLQAITSPDVECKYHKCEV